MEGSCGLIYQAWIPSGCRKPIISAGDGRAEAQAPAGTSVFCDVKLKPSKIRHPKDGTKFIRSGKLVFLLDLFHPS